MRIRNTYGRILTAFICTILLLAGCGTNNNAEETIKETKDVTVTDAMGQVTIPANPERILAPYMEDSLVALGVKPAAQWSIGTTVLDYLQTDLKDVPTIGWDLPLEQTIQAKPDLIIFSSASAIQNGNYEEYKKVAPTYVFKDEEGSDWRKQLQVMGTLLGKEEQAKTVLADYEAKAKQASDKIHAAIGDETAAIIWVVGDQFYLFENTRFAANVLYGDLGVVQPDMIQKLPAAEATWKPVSLEALSDLDADHLFLVGKPGESGLETLQKSSVWNGIPAVKNGNVYQMEDPSHWTMNGVIANNLTIDKIVDSLTK